MLRVFLLTAGLILYGSLFPWSFRPHPYLPLLDAVRHSWPGRFDRWLIRDLVINVVLYLPLGISGALAFTRPRWRSWLIPIAAGCLLSATVEYLQLYTLTRTSSACDFAANSAGAAAGALAAHLVRIRRPLFHSAGQHPDALVILGLFVAWQFFPYMPVSGRAAFVAKLEALSVFKWVEFVSVSAAWMAATISFRLMWPGNRSALLLLVLPVRLFIAWSPVTGSAAAGAAVGWLAAQASISPAICASLAGVALVVRELAPFRFPGPARKFIWVPFVAMLGDDWIHAWQVLLEKTFLYGAIVWLLARCGISIVWSTATVAAALLALEFIQARQPAHIPEITDAALAILLGGLLAMTIRRDRIPPP